MLSSSQRKNRNAHKLTLSRLSSPPLRRLQRVERARQTDLVSQGVRRSGPGAADMAASSRLKARLPDDFGGSKLNESFVSVRTVLPRRRLTGPVRNGAALARRHQEGHSSSSNRARAESCRTLTSSCRSGSRTCGTRRVADGCTARSRVRQADLSRTLNSTGGFSAGVRCAIVS